MLPEYTTDSVSTTLPLVLAANGSAFIVFRKSENSGRNRNSIKNFPGQIILNEINAPWKVRFVEFATGQGRSVKFDQLIDWTLSNDDKIKFYSGTAVYQNDFIIEEIRLGKKVLLDMGKVIAMATVTINGMEAGGVWTAPYQIDITRFIKKGINSIEIKVVNTWVNRLIGDAALPVEERKTWLSVNPYNADSKLEASGLMGPVVIKSVQY
jgi:hypothetical protein